MNFCNFRKTATYFKVACRTLMSKFFISDKFLETAVAKTTRVDMRLWRNKECRKKKV